MCPKSPAAAIFRLNLAHRADISEAIWAAFTAPPEVAGGIFNVADDGAATKAEVVAWLAARLGVPPPRFTGEPATGRRALAPDRVIANTKLKRELGRGPRSRLSARATRQFCQRENKAASKPEGRAPVFLGQPAFLPSASIFAVPFGS